MGVYGEIGQQQTAMTVRACGQCWTRQGRYRLWDERKNMFIVMVRYTEQRQAGRGWLKVVAAQTLSELGLLG